MSRVGRDLAPYLKALVPMWHLSCSDPHFPAASIAKNAFLQAFNGDKSKHVEVVLFCQMEVLALISDNLLHQKASTLSDPK